MAAFAILRFSKLKTVGAVAASGSHMMRSRPAPNADPAVSNRILIGSADPANDVDTRLSAATQRRKNSVLAIEVMASASPEWFATATKQQKREWVRSSRDWLVGHFGEENVSHLQLHLDETTPHLTGFIVPVDPDSGRLNAARWMDGSAKLAEMQTDYAKAVESLGLVRGLEGSDATHTTIKQFYGAMRAPDVAQLAAPSVAIPPVMLRESARKDWADAEGKRLTEAMTPAAETLRAQARQGIIAARNADAYQATAVRFREAAQAARDVPLHEVAERLQLGRDKTDRDKWVDAEGRFALTLTGQQWFDHKAQQGGGGAIDLAAHVMDCDFKQAVSWLGHGVGLERATAAVRARSTDRAETAVKAAQAARRPFAAPPRGSADQTDQVRAYLTQQRGLAPIIVTTAIRRGTVYADTRGNAVFAAVDASGAVAGAELRGTGAKPFHGLAPGSTRDACFTASTARSTAGSGRKLVLVESAIDALSYLQLHPGEGLLVASTSGARPALPSSLAKHLVEVDEVVVAYDSDKVGQSIAKKLMASLRSIVAKVSLAVPPFGKDWNEALRERGRSPAVSAPERVLCVGPAEPRASA